MECTPKYHQKLLRMLDKAVEANDKKEMRRIRRKLDRFLSECHKFLKKKGRR